MRADTLDTPENWKAITDSTLKRGDVVRRKNQTRRYRIAGFGPYFVWAEELGTDREVRLSVRHLTLETPTC